jgi:hypothetical protein
MYRLLENSGQPKEEQVPARASARMSGPENGRCQLRESATVRWTYTAGQYDLGGQ